MEVRIKLVLPDELFSNDFLPHITLPDDLTLQAKLTQGHALEFSLVSDEKSAKNASTCPSYDTPNVEGTKKRRLVQRKSSAILRRSIKDNTGQNNNNSITLSERSEESVTLDEKRKFVPDRVLEFLDYWFSQDLLLRGESTKTFSKDVEALKKLVSGKFFKDKDVPWQYQGRSFSLDEWKLAVDRFKIMASDYDFAPQNKEPLLRTAIHQFLFNPFRAKKGSAFDNNIQNSLFLVLLQQEPKRIKGFPDEYPEITERFVYLFSEYRKEVHRDYRYSPQADDLKRFTQATKRTLEFFKDMRDDIPHFSMEFSRKNSIPDFVWAAVLWSMEGSDIPVTPGFLCSDRTFKQRLPDYLRHKRMMK